MILGELTLINKTGIFLKKQVSLHTSVEGDADRLEDNRHLQDFDMECNETEVELFEPIQRYITEPLDIQSKGGYITGSFKDNGLASGPYTVKAWLMIEEEPQTING